MSELLVRRLGGNYSSINCTSAGGRRRLLSRAVNEPSRSFTVTCYGPTGNFKKLCHLISGNCETSRRFIDIDSSSPQLSGRHLDNRQVTTCCKPRAGPGIGWDQARLATAGYYRPGPGDGCQENMSSLQTSSQYFHILALLYRLRGLNTFRPELVIYISGRGPSAIHFWCHNKWTCHVTPFSLKLHWAAKPTPGIISMHYFVANISHFIFCGWNPLTNVLCYKQHLGF